MSNTRKALATQQASVAEATARADNVRSILLAGAEQVFPLLQVSHARKDYLALGHASFAEYVRAEYRGWVPGFESIGARDEVMKELVAAGIPQRDVGAMTGTSGATVNRAVNPPPVPNETSAGTGPEPAQPDQDEQQDEPDQADEQQPEQRAEEPEVDLKHAARYVITQLDMAYPHRRNVALLAERYDGGTGEQVDKAAIIADVLAGLSDQVVASFEDLKGHIVGLAEPINRAGGTTHLAGLMFRGSLVKSAYKPPEDCDTPFVRARKLAQTAGKKLDAMLDVAGLDATDAHDLMHLMHEVEDTLTEVYEFLEVLQRE